MARLEQAEEMADRGVPLRFTLNERKAAQAAAVLLEKHGRPMTKGVLIKLLYLADRRSLKETGHPITGDRPVSMPYGPVLSTLLSTINQESVAPSVRLAWTEYISEPVHNLEVSLRKPEPEVDELSRYELSVLTDIYTEFGQKTFGALVDYTHDLPEWEDPRGSSVPIDPAAILREAGWDEDEIQAVAQEVAEEGALRRALAEIR